jgi:hypothetical protein
MIIGHRMNSVGLFILMPGGSGLPSPDIAASKGCVTRILLAAVLEGCEDQERPGGRWMTAPQ